MARKRGRRMTPDEYRKKYPSCRTCEYFYEDALKIKCLVKNCIPEFARAKKCKCYKPIPFKEEK